MGKGRKQTINNNSDWVNVFFNSVGTYVNIINTEFSKTYPLEPLSNYIKIGGGYAFKTSEYKKAGVPIIRISDFNNELIDVSNCVYYNEDDSLSKYELNESDIIICLTGGTIAKLGIVQKGLGKLYMNQRVGKFIVLDESKFEKEFVYWIARSVQSIIKNLAWGAAIPNVSPKQIEQLKFSIPSVKIQKQIIGFLNDLKNNSLSKDSYFDKKIESKIIELQENQFTGINISSNLVYQLDLIKELRQAFLREAMQGKLVKSTNTAETGQQLLAKIKAEKAKLVVEKKIKKEKELPSIKDGDIPFEIPKHWAWCRLGEVSFDVSYGTSQKADDISEIPVLRMGNITSDGRILYSNLKYVSANIKDLPNLYLKDNDLVFNRTNSYELVGKCGVFENKDAFTLASYLIRVRLIKDINSKFISNYINSSFCRKTQIEPQIIQQNGQANFNGTKLSNIIIPFPPFHEQEQIIAKLEELMAFCDDLEKSIKESQNYNNMLLQQVLREALQPKNEPKIINITNRKIENPLKTILAGHIINLNNTTDFGRVKFQKLLFLTEYICKIDFDSNYIKKVAGPYDEVLIKNIEEDFNRMRFFNVVQDNTDNKRVRYHALAGATELETLFLENFSDESVRINNTLLKFRPLSWGECELIATLYAVWNNRIIKNELITDELLYSDFMAWDAQKKKYHSVFHKWLFWMKDERIIPDGWGKYIGKPN